MAEVAYRAHLSYAMVSENLAAGSPVHAAAHDCDVTTPGGKADSNVHVHALCICTTGARDTTARDSGGLVDLGSIKIVLRMVTLSKELGSRVCGRFLGL
jgi:hypothetical protein